MLDRARLFLDRCDVMLSSTLNKRTLSMVLWRCPALSSAGQVTPNLLMKHSGFIHILISWNFLFLIHFPFLAITRLLALCRILLLFPLVINILIFDTTYFGPHTGGFFFYYLDTYCRHFYYSPSISCFFMSSWCSWLIYSTFLIIILYFSPSFFSFICFSPFQWGCVDLYGSGVRT